MAVNWQIGNYEVTVIDSTLQTSLHYLVKLK